MPVLPAVCAQSPRVVSNDEMDGLGTAGVPALSSPSLAGPVEAQPGLDLVTILD